MTLLVRLGKFNLVGAMGMGVQLALLALFNHLVPGHYLWATSVALEIAVIHNFCWHMHFTWKDRGVGSDWMTQCLRFHLSNGLVSLIGNLILMRLLVQNAHMPVLFANVIAIGCCAVANFLLGDLWAFRVAR